MKRVPRVPSNYIMTECGLLPNPNIADSVRELYSNYFMTREISFSSEVFHRSQGAELVQRIVETKDFEDTNNENGRISEAEIILNLSDYTDFNEFTTRFESTCHQMGYNAKLAEEYEELNIYNVGDDFKVRVEVVETIKKGDFLNSYETEKTLMFSVYREKEKEYIVDTIDCCLFEMGRFRDFLEFYGIDWDTVLGDFSSFGYDDLHFTKRYDEVPREFWEGRKESWERLNVNDLEEITDCLLGVYARNKGDDVRQLELKNDIKYVQKLISEKSVTQEDTNDTIYQ